jgi:hypothetical protein
MEMSIRKYINSESREYLYKILKRYGESLLDAHKQYSHFKEKSPELASSLSNSNLKSASHDSLCRTQRQFKQLYEHRDMLCDKLKLHKYPVLDKALCVTPTKENDITKVRELMRGFTQSPSLVTQKKGHIVIIVDNQSIQQTRELLQSSGINKDNIFNLSSDGFPPIVAGMASPKEVVRSLEEINKFLLIKSNHVVQNKFEQDYTLQ